MSRIGRATGRAIVGAVLLAGLLGCAGAPSVEHARRAGPHITVYTPMVLRRDLTWFPGAWLGHVVWVRARAVQSFVWSCQHDNLCVDRAPSLADPAVATADARLLLLLPAENRLVTLARRLPLLGRLMPPASTIAWGRVALYHVRLTAAPSCGDPSCVMAQLVD